MYNGDYYYTSVSNCVSSSSNCHQRQLNYRNGAAIDVVVPLPQYHIEHSYYYYDNSVVVTSELAHNIDVDQIHPLAHRSR